MEELVQWTREAFENKILHPLLIIAIFIVIFLAIHPFQDGNGRISRLLTTLLMLKYGYQYVPYSSLESIIEANKESYYLALQQTQKWAWFNLSNRSGNRRDNLGCLVCDEPIASAMGEEQNEQDELSQPLYDCYSNLNHAQKSWFNHTPNWTPWLTFFFAVLTKTKTTSACQNIT